ncbi:hypothetical protein PR048_010504 [Dryococelus australis]|uniref:Transposase n=1 Tax=Dryococelus australis TaxID=614101 RepID=A0ABQ9I409_9NEOP|nr:hypothetical protein PR048_010504 [Dryococelus australis]
MLPTLWRFYGMDPYYLQDDHARCHVSKATMQWYANNNVRRLYWPAQSPDLNSIELWDELYHRVRGRQARPKPIAQLMEWLQEGWRRIPVDVLQTLTTLYGSLSLMRVLLNAYCSASLPFNPPAEASEGVCEGQASSLWGAPKFTKACRRYQKVKFFQMDIGIYQVGPQRPSGYSDPKWGRSGIVAKATPSGDALDQWLERSQSDPKWGRSGSVPRAIPSGDAVDQWLEHWISGEEGERRGRKRKEGKEEKGGEGRERRGRKREEGKEKRGGEGKERRGRKRKEGKEKKGGEGKERRGIKRKEGNKEKGSDTRYLPVKLCMQVMGGNQSHNRTMGEGIAMGRPQARGAEGEKPGETSAAVNLVRAQSAYSSRPEKTLECTMFPSCKAGNATFPKSAMTEMSEEIWVALDIEVLRADDGEAREIPEKNPGTRGNVRHDSRMRKNRERTHRDSNPVRPCEYYAEQGYKVYNLQYDPQQFNQETIAFKSQNFDVHWSSSSFLFYQTHRAILNLFITVNAVVAVLYSMDILCNDEEVKLQSNTEALCWTSMLGETSCYPSKKHSGYHSSESGLVSVQEIVNVSFNIPLRKLTASAKSPSPADCVYGEKIRTITCTMPQSITARAHEMILPLRNYTRVVKRCAVKFPPRAKHCQEPCQHSETMANRKQTAWPNPSRKVYHCATYRIFTGELSSISGGVAPRFSHVAILPDDAAGREGFLGISHLPCTSFRRCSILTSLHLHRLSKPRRQEPLNSLHSLISYLANKHIDTDDGLSREKVDSAHAEATGRPATRAQRDGDAVTGLPRILHCRLPAPHTFLFRLLHIRWQGFCRSVSGNLTYTKQSAVYKIVYQLTHERTKVNLKLAILSALATHIRQISHACVCYVHGIKPRNMLNIRRRASKQGERKEGGARTEGGARSPDLPRNNRLQSAGGRQQFATGAYEK